MFVTFLEWIVIAAITILGSALTIGMLYFMWLISWGERQEERDRLTAELSGSPNAGWYRIEDRHGHIWEPWLPNNSPRAWDPSDRYGHWTSRNDHQFMCILCYDFHKGPARRMKDSDRWIGTGQVRPADDLLFLPAGPTRCRAANY